MDLIVTDIGLIPNIVSVVRDGFNSHNVWNFEKHKSYRSHQLQKMMEMMIENEEKIHAALKIDLNRSKGETMLSESLTTVAEIGLAIESLDKWMTMTPVETDEPSLSERYLKPNPYGVALIIGAWNFPLQTVLNPLIGAIAAGNSAILKPSEVSSSVSNLITELIPKYLDSKCYAVVSGGVAVSQTVLKERFDYIFYTGSTAVGRLVMKAAAENLTPVTLEMGGKSPVIVADDAVFDIAARRIMWGKLLNAGQVCIAPDYVLCTKHSQDKLVQAFTEAIKDFLGNDPIKSSDYCRIVNKRHYKRITKLMDTSKGRNVLSGSRDEEELYIAPAVYVDVDEDDSLMQEELFGPVLPIVTVQSMEEAIQFTNKREKPLVLYLFTENKELFHEMCDRATASAVSHNDTMTFSEGPLPFGGVGHSGMGCYNGKYTFDTFSHMKRVHSTSMAVEDHISLRYPPLTNEKVEQILQSLDPTINEV